MMGPAFVPALRFRWLTPVFDPFMAIALPDLRIKRDLAEALQPADSRSILDLPLLEIKRVLRPGGTFYTADFDRARNPILRLVFKAVRLLDGRRNTRTNAKGLLPKLMEEAGFTSVGEAARYATMLGEVSTFEAKKALPIDRSGHLDTKEDR